MESESAKLSKLPSAVSSPGKSGFTSMSSASRSRIALLYSARVRRCTAPILPVYQVFPRRRHDTIGGRIRPWLSGRGHGARAKLQDDFFKRFTVGARGGEIHRFEIETGRSGFLAMTRDAVLVDYVPGTRRRGSG